ncbi:basic leucine zipper 43-like [Chenopodium quinoa]|uniref:basic leucine zipper 43-like n=1 Tax=Chenopodium quinoa TaxID=63459 RepID=UPI000B779011|nr:basic leucine zipper 43-like [Chenopodium quinoa]
MNQCKIEDINHMAFEYQNSFPSNFSLIQDDLQPSNQTSLNFDEFNLQARYLHNTSSTSNEAENKQDNNLIDERKHRRMVSNRESARRSRMRKKRQINELWSQVLRLKGENHELVEKLNHASESHNQVVQENNQLKEETSNLRNMATYVQLDTDDLNNALRDLEDI